MSELRTTGLTVRYGQVVAVADLDLTVGAGQIVGLIGPNGAGKTTTIDAITGFTKSTGRVSFDGTDITTWPAHRRARRGLGRTWQSLELFDDLTVRENLAVAADHEPLAAAFRRRKRGGGPVDRALASLGLDALAHRYPTELSQGQRKLVSAARALAAEPSIVCMDEPAAGLDSDESGELGGRLRRMADDGIGILLVDHDMGLVLEVCDHVVVIDFGRQIAGGAPNEIRTDPVVLEAYLGTTSTVGDGAGSSSSSMNGSDA